MMKPFSRRELLRRFGLAAGSLPLLDAMAERASADPLPPPKRLVCITLWHGIFAQHWLPYVPRTMPISTNSPGSMLRAPSQFLRPMPFEQRDGCAVIDLGGETGALGPVFSAKWQSIKAKTAFIHNLSCSNNVVQGHTASAMLGGYKNPDPTPGTPYGYSLTGETLDLVIGRKLNGREPLVLKAPDYIDDVRFLEDSVGPTIRRNSDGIGFEMAPCLRDPFQTWDRLFANDVPPPTGPRLRDPKNRRAALLERTLQAVQGISRDARLSTADRQRLANHASILEAQRAVALIPSPPTPVAATRPDRPTGRPGVDAAAFNLAKGELFRAQFRNGAAAIKMNKTQALTINTGLENEWLTEGINLGSSQAYHGSAGHLANPSEAVIEECRKAQQLVFDTIADFLIELDTLEDPATGSTYLDNTMVLVALEHDGRPNGHLRGAVPSILAGGFGTFDGGKVFDYSRPALWQPEDSCIYQGFSYSRLIHTVLGAFGVSAAERAHMDIQGVRQDWSGADITDWNLPLTGLRP